MKLLVSSPNLLTEKSQIYLSELRWEIDQDDTDSDDQESGIVGTYDHLCVRIRTISHFTISSATGAFLIGIYRSIGITSTCRICTII